MAVEREQKYLVRSSAWRKRAGRGEHYRQGYLSIDPERSVRVRARKKKAVITVKAAKGDGAGLARSEFEYSIPVADANELLDHVCSHPVIEKTRFQLHENGHVWDIDQFENQNAGLVLAELETANGQPPKAMPRWVGEDVSKDSRFTNARLAEHPYSEWRGRAARPEAKYHWKPDEGVSEGFHRIVSEELQLAIWQLSENASSVDDSVSEARKTLKKIRSVMRLLHGTSGRKFDGQYQRENPILRDAGRRLSPVRDAQALIEIFDELNRKYREKLGDRDLFSVRDGLVA